MLNSTATNRSCFVGSGSRCRRAPALAQPRSRLASRPSSSRLIPRGSKGDEDGWLAWDDAPETPRVNGTPLPPAVEVEAEAAAVEVDWRSEVQGLAESLRNQASGSDSEAASWDSSYDGERERCFLVGVQLKGKSDKHGYGVQESLEELGRLADTAGLEVVGHTYQMLDVVNPRTYIGSGKVQEIKIALENAGATTVIFDDELSPGQLRNLERAFGDTVGLCDRTALILDIFSQRAATREGKLQVELAQSEYQLPRLTRMWSHLERQGGSGQTKGMGEKQIEVDRRLLKGRMARLRKDLEDRKSVV